MAFINKRVLLRVIKLAAIAVYLISKIPTTGDLPSLNPSATDLVEETEANRKVTGAGFHLQMETSIANEASDVEFGLIERLPGHVFVDVYQIQEQVRMQRRMDELYEIKLEPARLDLEAPANSEKSMDFVVAMRQQGRAQLVRFKLPFHVRYHAPSAERREERISIPPAIVCSTRRNDDKQGSEMTKRGEEDQLCKEYFGSKFSAHPRQPFSQHTILIQVPVGDLNQAQGVFLISLLAVLFGTLAIGKVALVG